MSDATIRGVNARKLTARVRHLEQQVDALARDTLELHQKLGLLLDDATPSAAAATEARSLGLQPSARPDSLPRRISRKILSLAARTVRTIRRAADPGAETVRILSPVSDDEPHSAVTMGDDADFTSTAAPDDGGFVPTHDEAAWLFAVENVDAVWVHRDGHPHPLLVGYRKELGTHAPEGPSGLAAAANVLGRPIITKVLPAANHPTSERVLLHRANPADTTSLWTGSDYLVALPQATRRAELRLNTTSPPTFAIDPVDLFVLLTEPLIEGLEQRLARGLEAAAGRSQLILSLATHSEAGSRRLHALAAPGRSVLRLGAILHRATWETVVRSVFAATKPRVLWAIGPGDDAMPWIRLARSTVAGVRVVLESPTPGNAEADATIVPSEVHRARLEGTPGLGTLHVAPTPVPPASSRSGNEVRRTLGVPADATLVVVAGDLSANARPEDAAAVARRFAGDERVHFRVVGRGPLASSVDDLGRLFDLRRFAVCQPDHALEDLVAAADVVCCPGEHHVLPPAAAMAVASGTPIAAPAEGEFADLAAAGVEGIHLGGKPGDIESLAKAIAAAVATGAPAAGGLSEPDQAARSEHARRVYDDVLGGHQS